MNKYKLGELIEITSSKRIHAEDYVEYGVPFYRSKEIIQLSKGEKITEVLHISKEQYNKIKSRFPIPKNGDILLTSVGTIGIPYYVRDENFYFKDGNLTWFRNFSEKVNSKYLLFWMQSNFFKSQINNNNIGAVQKALTIDFLKKFNIQLPNLNEQKKITSTLTSIISKIELNNKINAELEAMAKTLYDYWFVQFDFPDVNGKPYKSSGGKMIWNAELKREIPEGWEVMSIDDYAEVKKGELITAKDSEIGEIKVIAAGIGYSYMHSKSNRERNTITISGSGANAGFINFWREPIFASDCITVRGNTDTETLMLLQHLKFIQEHILRQATGSAQPHVYPSDIKRLNYIVPPNGIIAKFGKIIIPKNDKVGVNIKENQELASLRDWLLPMLMNGQVSVASTSSATKDGYEVEDRVLGMVAEEKTKY
jgi:type I restriction enzyme S subunit